MISKGFMYVRDPDETDHTKRIGIDGKMIFEILSDDYHIDLMAADKHTDTIVVVLKRKTIEDKPIPGVQFYESLDEKIFVECSNPPGDSWVYRAIKSLNAMRQALDEKQSEQICQVQELIWELYKENRKLKEAKDA